MTLYFCAVIIGTDPKGPPVMACHYAAADAAAARDLARAEFVKPCSAELYAQAPEAAAISDRKRAEAAAAGFIVTARKSKAKDPAAWAMNPEPPVNLLAEMQARGLR
jgi:hypothetical protein